MLQARQCCQIYDRGSQPFALSSASSLARAQLRCMNTGPASLGPPARSRWLYGGHIVPGSLWLIAKQKWKVIVSVWMSSLCLRPRHQHSALWWHWGKRRAEKKRNRGRLLSSCHQICSNCTSECRRGREGAGVRGRGLLAQWQGAQWWHSSLSCGHTDNTTHAHTAAPGGFPSGVPKWSNTTHHCLITPVPKDRREECFHEPWHRRCTVYHSGIAGHYMMLSWCVFHFF